MNRIRALLIFGLAVGRLAAQWSDPITISDGYAPDFDIDPNNGHLHIVSILAGVIYTEMDELGRIISSPAVIPGTSRDVEYWNFGATVAVDKSGYPHVCFRVPKGDFYYDLYYTRKTASGWMKNPLLISSSQRRGYVTRMAVDSKDNVHVLQSTMTGNIIGPIIYYRIKNVLVNHTIPDLNPMLTYYRTDNRFEVTIDKNDVIHVIAGCPGIPNLTNEGPITYFKSTNHGDSFQTVADVHNVNCNNRNGAPDIAVDDNGVLNMVYGAKIDVARNSRPSLRYVRFHNNRKLVDIPITNAGECKSWGYPEGYDPAHGKNYGLGSISTSNDGELVMAALVTSPSFYSGGSFFRGDLYVYLSSDSGYTWAPRQLLEEDVSDNEGRNVQMIRSYKNNFYVVYPHNVKPKKIKMRYIRNLGDDPPKAHAGGPYQINEGSLLTLNAALSTDTGQNRGIVNYEWDLNNDGIFEHSSAGPSFQTTMANDYYSTIRLRVTDRAGYTDEAVTTLTVKNVSPTAAIGNDRTINEGESTTLHCVVTDPGTEDTHTFLWNFGDGQTSTEQSPVHRYIDDGQFQVSVTVTDNNNGTGQASLKITVLNVAPVADAGGPYQGSINVPVQVTGTATDPGLTDMQNLTYQWDMNHDSYFESNGQTVSYTFTTEGIFQIVLKVRDNADFDTDTTTVTISNDPPVISLISSQTIPEGGIFQPVNLDDFVSDPDQADDELSWQVSGYSQLLVTITNRVLNVASPHEDWNGSEIIQLKVTDPGNYSDSTQVTYTITPVNDPPVWITAVPDFVINEDALLIIPWDSLYLWTEDIDNPDQSLTFSITAPATVTWQEDTENHRLIIAGAPNWYGQASLVFTVRDPGGLAASDTSLLTVLSVPDNPADFHLLTPILLDSTDKSWPDSLRFTWEMSHDPDDPAGAVYYVLYLNHMNGMAGSTFTVIDSTYMFYPDTASLPDGGYLWHVTAYATSGLFTISQEQGAIFVGNQGSGSSVSNRPMPGTFALQQNYPNPFNPATQITYHIAETVDVVLSVFNALGEEIVTLVNTRKMPGIYTVTWQGMDTQGQKVSSGLYFCRMQAGTHLFLKKMMLLQ